MVLIPLIIFSIFEKIKILLKSLQATSFLNQGLKRKYRQILKKKY